MSRSDLRALFRSNNQSLKAVDVFADRENEWAAVARSITARAAEARDPAFDVEDLESPRRNVLTFYGVGGIGKTSLSRQIAEHLAGDDHGPRQWPPLDPSVGPVIPVRLDLSTQAGLGFESVMLALRVAVASLGRPMTAFDLAFHRYWAHNHPGEPLEEYLRRNTFFSRFSTSLSVPEQMRSALADTAQALMMPGTLGVLVGQTLKTVVRSLRDHRLRSRALGGCRRLPDLLEAEPDLDTLSYYAHLLAWDLSQLPAERSATLVVLLDTFEDIGDRTHRDAERLVQRLAWLMPNALFVITGRNRLQWDDDRLEGQLDWVGTRCWPLLAPGAEQDPRQHRIGYLSAEDAERYLCRRLTLDEQPLMDEQTRHLIIARSHGLPLYLDLAVMRFLDLYHQQGTAPAAAKFNHDFPALVARTFRDLTAPERQVLRAVSLLDAFSIPLARAAAGHDRDAPAMQLAERPFIEHQPAAPWPYYLHNLVRSAIRDADSTAEDRWSPADWQRTAARAFAALGTEYSAARADGDRRKLLGCLHQGLRLARDFNLGLDWLVDAAYAYVEDFVWEPVELPPAGAPSAGGTPAVIPHSGPAANPPTALAAALSAIARRQRQHRQLTADTLRDVLASGLLPESLNDLPAYFLAECDRDLGRLQESMDGMRRVAAAGGRLAPDASRGMLHLARRLGHFPDVLTAAAALGRRGRKHRTLGDVWWSQGNITRACASYAQGRDDAEQQGQHGEAALSQACLAFAAAFQDRARAQEQIQRAEDMLTGGDARWAQLQVRNARLLRDAGAGPGLADRAAAVVREAEANGLTSSAAYARFAVCFDAAITDSPQQLESARQGLLLSVQGAEFAYLLELSYLMTGHRPPEDLPRAHWIDGVQETGARWRRLIDDRRAQLATTGD
ncbi:ATP/GTP-binding protein [Kitasatospora indigofera]|uniref:ATP/GTP-binding protein n=1 Tax=Kitasatospora indigofera TaxID=67307 RepID=A0A919D9B5_9ACTN|nr:ATP/GTP-binding protein [Kitasatospora indigofera]